MSSLDGQDLFGSGPHSIRPETWSRAVQYRGFAGINGLLTLDMGLRSRRINQTGRLQAATTSAIHAIVSEIEAKLDGGIHTLTDDLGFTYPTVLVERFEQSTPVRRSQGFWCDYKISYRQLP
ncbi:MAG: hypothetical protein ACYTF6_00055 [Planctomycetota bacterium]|jgi:hypothetical protein